MKPSYKKLGLYSGFLVLVLLLGSCTSETNEKNREQPLSEKIAALQARLEQKETLTAEEKRSLKNLVKEYDQPQVSVGEQNHNYIFDDLSRDHIEFSSIEEVPVFNSCNATGRDAQSACVEEQIAQFVQKNFNPAVGEHLEVTGVHMVEVSFVIDQQGLVNDIKTRYAEKSLEDEAKRVIALLPRMRPGKHKGKTMAALYSLPIRYRVL